MANPYQILRVQPDCTPEQVEEAYYRMRRLASYGEGVKEETINLAYAILSDPQRRARIDEALQRRRPSSPPVTVAQAARPPRASRGTRGLLQRLLPFL
ncbi:MAG TPA: hypothetical protein VJV23_17005 [Candidatus Polarisedimenticolia bacterium]|nr:hypothetical protein [Candidatus Polarisedimenticolia bacterium]